MKTTPLGLLILLPLWAVRADEPEAPKGDAAVRGRLEFKSRRAAFDGTDVGQAGNPRKYIAGDPDSPHRAIWHFEKLPKGVAAPPGDVVPAKLTCSHFHLVKAAAPGARVVVRAVSHTCPQVPPDMQQKGEWQWVGKNSKGKSLKDQYQDDVAAYRAKKIDPAKPDADGWKAANALAEKYGYYETRLTAVLDLVEADIDLPAGLFRNALKNDAEVGADGKPKRPMVSIYLHCETPGLLLGMREADLRLVEKVAPKK